MQQVTHYIKTEENELKTSLGEYTKLILYLFYLFLKILFRHLPSDNRMETSEPPQIRIKLPIDHSKNPNWNKINQKS